MHPSLPDAFPTLTTTFPAIAAKIDADRPILAQAIPHLRVARVEDHRVILVCNDPPTSELLSSSSQGAYFADLFNAHFGRPIQIKLNHLPPDARLEDFAPITPSAPSETSDPPKRRTSNTLTFLERQLLQHWMQQPENARLVAHESDTNAARTATTALNHDRHPTEDVITITPGNIHSMRKLLGIEKIKPEKPAPLPPDLNLADLQQQVQGLCVEATGMRATIANLHMVLSDVCHHINDNLPRETIISPLAPLDDLPTS